jgi:hypothetical protein
MATKSYAIWWTEGEGPRRAGKLELGSSYAFLAGRDSDRISLEDIESLEYRHGEINLRFGSERLLHIGSLDAPGALREAARRLMAERHVWRVRTS